MTPRLPVNSDRTICVGRTGTGKTVAGIWHLSNYNVETFPWIVIDFKNDEHINSIEPAEDIDFNFVPGRKDIGLFRLHCTPYDTEVSKGCERSRLDDYLIKIWERENCGLFVDEAYIIGNSEAMNLCLTQGRSKRIPMIICTQRPVWVSRFAFSEASFIQVFDLNDDRDIDTIESFTPIDWGEEDSLGRYQSFYYDVAENHLVRFNPVPDMDKLRQKFEDKMPVKRWKL